jgi:iron complex transport system substrate-binding protein
MATEAMQATEAMAVEGSSDPAVAGLPALAAPASDAVSVKPTSARTARDLRPAQRIVSINPSLTAILVSIGALDRLVGIDDYSARSLPEVSHLPRVGGLYSPSLESVVALRPDLVVLVPSAEQRDFRERLARLGVRVSAFENIHFDEVLENIERLGAIAQRPEAAAARVNAISRTRAEARRLVAGRPAPRVIVVLQREPVFVVGSGSFVAEMIEDLGGANLGAEFPDPYPQVAMEWLIASAPEVLIDLSLDAEPPEQYWSRWPSLPALNAGRVMRLDAQLVSMPGPQLDEALRSLAAGLHGEALATALDRALAR